MNNKIVIITSIFIILLLIFSNTVISYEKSDRKKLNSAIIINGNNEFTSNNGVVGGDGTEENPYIISDLIIKVINPNKSSGINIKNTDKHFIIENCHIIGNNIFPTFGIYLENVKNGTIKNCICKKNKMGIIISSSSDNTVDNCICKNCDIGLSINGCPSGDNPSSNNNMVKNCFFKRCDNGTYFCCIPNSYNNVFESCTYEDNEKGVLFDHISNRIIFTNCNFKFNDVGIEIHSTSIDNFFSNNVFYQNKIHAIDNSKNYWDNGPIHGGNIWYNHDTSQPYYIDGKGDNVDRYPKDELDEKNLISYFNYSPKINKIGEKVFFDATGAYCSDKEIKEYEWSFGDGSYGCGKKVYHMFSSEKTYNVTLKVITDNTNDVFSRELEIINYTGKIVTIDNSSSIQQTINGLRSGMTIYVNKGVYKENIVIDKPYVKLLSNNTYDTIIDGCKTDDVIRVESSYVTISGFTIKNSSDNRAGINIGKEDYIIDSINCNITNNILKDNSIGIKIVETNSNYISNNKFHDNEIYGIFTHRSYDNIIKDNDFFKNKIAMYLLWGSNWNDITLNEIYENQIGLFLEWSNYVKIYKNNITKNQGGIYILNSLSPEIHYNNIFYNFDYGSMYNYDGIKNLRDISKNYWGSKNGPSGLIKFFGDRVIGEKTILKFNIRYGFSSRKLCKNWLDSPVKLLN